MMRIDFASIDAGTRYKLLCATVIPRPIAWITTLGEDGIVNAAPFSFFNVFGEDPPLLVVGLQHRRDRTQKDTTANIAATGEFVVNIATAPLLDALVATAADYPPGVSEVEALGLATAPSAHIGPPRLAAVPIAFECRRHTSLAFGPGREIMIGKVLAMHARDAMVDETTYRVDWGDELPLARLFGDAYGVVGQILRRSVQPPRPFIDTPGVEA